MNNHEKKVAERIKDLIKQKDSTAKVVLYGSHARGDFNDSSDWDILVLLDRDDVDIRLEQEFRHLLFDLELEISEPISIYVHSKSSWDKNFSVTPFYKNIQREGVVLA